MQTYAPTRETTGNRRLARDLGLAVVIGLVGALAKKHLDFHLGIPGHAGVGWIAVLIFGRLVNRRPGMAAVAGVSMGLWSVPVGLGHSLGYNLALYGSVAALLDLPGLRRLTSSGGLFGAVTAGILVHVAKFVFVLANVWLSGTVRTVELYGLSSALVNHVAFGAAGGLVGWGLFRTGRALVARFGRPTDWVRRGSW
jgi:hypothetical protein